MASVYRTSSLQGYLPEIAPKGKSAAVSALETYANAYTEALFAATDVLCQYRVPKGAKTVRAEDIARAASILRSKDKLVKLDGAADAEASTPEDSAEGKKSSPLVFSVVKSRFLSDETGKTKLHITSEAKSFLIKDVDAMLEDARERLAAAFVTKAAPLSAADVISALESGTGETVFGTGVWIFRNDAASAPAPRPRKAGAKKAVADAPAATQPTPAAEEKVDEEDAPAAPAPRPRKAGTKKAAQEAPPAAEEKVDEEDAPAAPAPARKRSRAKTGSTGGARGRRAADASEE